MARRIRTNKARKKNKSRVVNVRPFVEELGKEISREWVGELKGNGASPREEGILKLLIGALAKEVAKELRETDNGTTVFGDTLIMANKGPAAKGLAKAERKLAKLVKHGHPDDTEDEDEKKGKSAKYPNLKYRKPKYENVESILKFVESKDEKGGGVKLVIMNFND